MKRTSFRLNEKLNKLLITDYAKVENKEQKRCQPHASHDSSAFQAFKWTRIRVFHDNNKDFKSRHSFVGGDFKDLVQTKPMCENTRTNILMKVSVSGSTSLKESEKEKFTNHGVRKTTVSKLKKANLIYCNFRIYRHCQTPQRYKFPQRLRWSQRRRATMTLSCNIQMNNKNSSAEKK